MVNKVTWVALPKETFYFFGEGLVNNAQVPIFAVLLEE
jgi:hypothetical protein